MDSSRNAENHQWPNNIMAAGGAAGMMMMGSSAALFPPPPTNFPNYNANPISPQSSICSLESMDPNINNHCFGIQEIRGRVGDDDYDDDNDNDDPIISFQECAKKIRFSSDLGELQALALRMMKN